MKATGTFLRNVWRLAHPYWFSEDRWAARALLAIIIGMNLGLVYLSVLFNKWRNTFYNALQDYDLKVFWHQLGIFCILAAIFIVVAVYQTYLQQMLQIRWRRWLTEHYLADWLKDHAYYRLQMFGSGTDNPDQRLADDLNFFVSQTLNLSLGLLSNIVSFFSFLGILWGLSGTLTFPFQGHVFNIPGYMVWAALLYAVIGTWLTHKIGRPLIALNYDQQKYEADFRFSLVRFRENVEGVALYHGEADEREIFTQRFGNVVRNWWGIMRMQKRLTWLTAGYGQVAAVFPFIAMAPRYFSKVIQLGALMQTAEAFSQVQGALSWVVNVYAGSGPSDSALVSWKATTDRLTSFQRSIDEARKRDHQSDGIVRAPGAAEALALSHLDIDLPDGRPLVAMDGINIAQGEDVLIAGPSGSGKSTLFRAIAGLWPFGKGSIALPAHGSTLFLPQKPYLPIGTLRKVVSYPTPVGGFDDAAIAEALSVCGLSRLTGMLDDSRYWAQQLSPGEQQRLAFARAILHKPAWLYMDEASSSLDEASEAALYKLVRERLPGTAIVSIGHRSGLKGLHRHRLELQKDGQGAGRLVPVPDATV